MTYRQVRGCAASVSPKTRPKVHLPARSAPRLRRNPRPAARTPGKTHRYLNGGRVLQSFQAGAAIGFLIAAAVSSHRLPSLRTHATAWQNFWKKLACGKTPLAEDCIFEKFCQVPDYYIYLAANFFWQDFSKKSAGLDTASACQQVTKIQFQFQFVYSQPIRIEAEKGRTLN